MKILIISRSYFPEVNPRAFRTSELANHLCDLGHNVTLMLSDISERGKELAEKHGLRIITYGKPNMGDIDLKKGGRFVILFKRVIRRLLNLFLEYPDMQFMFLVKKALVDHSETYDLLISIAAPHPLHWGVGLVRKEKGSIARYWVADCGDPFMGVTIDTFKKLFYFKYFEKMFCRRADYIAVPIENAVQAYYKEFHKKIVVIPQGFDFSVKDKLTPMYKQNVVPTFIYAGTFIPGARDPGKLMAFLTELDMDFKFIIYCKRSTLVDPWLKQLGSKVEVKPFIPRDEILPQLAKADFLVNINNNTLVQSPSKLIDYFLAGRPVVSVFGHDDMAEKVLPFLKGDYTQAMQFEKMERYDITNVAKGFLALSK